MKKILYVFVGLFLGALLTSCGNLGYSLVLWNNPEAGVSEGQLVKVYVKSNISHTYIIGIPETKKKVEIPVWQISEPESKRKTVKLAAKYKDYEHTYASVKADGLPIRAGTVNNAKQVYRLRKNEVIRVLYKGKGAAPTNGRGELPGDWLRVLTGTGTQGWCFSYNLNLFERVSDDLASSIVVEKTEDAPDEELSAILAKKWYPESFESMISSGRYDLEKFSPDYGFDFGIPVPETEAEGEVQTPVPEQSVKTLKLTTADVKKSWTYEKILKNGDNYQFDELQVTMTTRGKKMLAVQYMDSDGKMKNENFVCLDEDISELAEKEMMRRQEELSVLVAAGPVYESDYYGSIEFNNENSVTWRNYRPLVPEIISSSALGSVTVTNGYYLSKQLKNEFDGVLTMHFTGMETPVNFFYKLEEGGLRLVDASKAQKKGNLITEKGSGARVMYFGKK